MYDGELRQCLIEFDKGECISYLKTISIRYKRLYTSTESTQHFLLVQVATCIVIASTKDIFVFQEALQELKELQQLVPKDSLVYFMMGKV